MYWNIHFLHYVLCLFFFNFICTQRYETESHKFSLAAVFSGFFSICILVNLSVYKIKACLYHTINYFVMHIIFSPIEKKYMYNKCTTFWLLTKKSLFVASLFCWTVNSSLIFWSIDGLFIIGSTSHIILTSQIKIRSNDVLQFLRLYEISGRSFISQCN